MGRDMVVALKQAALQQSTLFGLNSYGTGPATDTLRHISGRVHAADEMLRLGTLEVPQVRRTYTILGSQPNGQRGLTHGFNEHGVAAGYCCWQSRLPGSERGLLGSDLVRLSLSRSQSARQAVDILTDLIARHGQRSPGAMWGNEESSADNIFLLCDAREAFVVEAVGAYWALLECQQVRAVSDVGLIRQDWRRLCPGLAELAIAQGWWCDDGSKLDVSGSLAAASTRHAGPLKRWGKATFDLEQQNGNIDSLFLRKMLLDHFDSTMATPPTAAAPQLHTSFVAVLPPSGAGLPMAWASHGPAGCPLYFPLFLHAEASDREVDEPIRTLLAPSDFADADGDAIREVVERLQGFFDQEADQFLTQLRTLLLQENERLHAARQAALLMRKHRELAETEWRRLTVPHRSAVPA